MSNDREDLAELREKLREAAALIHESADRIREVYNWLDVEIGRLDLPDLADSMASLRRRVLIETRDRANALQGAADTPIAVKALGQLLDREVKPDG